MKMHSGTSGAHPMNPVLDTNIIVDYLNGVEEAKTELLRYPMPAISIITWMEVMVGAGNEQEETTLRAFLQRFKLIPMNQDIAEIAVRLRKRFRIRIPDAIIWACAESENTILVTRNTRDFPEKHPAIRVPW